MPLLPSVAPFAGLLTDLANELRRGSCCLLAADKAWTHLLYHDLRERLRGTDVRCEYVDGRSSSGTAQADDVGVMLTAIAQLRRVVRGYAPGLVIALPHLDVMTAAAGGWTNISREVVPLLYEEPTVVLLGFQDPTLPLLPVVEKLFSKRFAVDAPFSVGQEPVNSDLGDGSAEGA